MAGLGRDWLRLIDMVFGGVFNVDDGSRIGMAMWILRNQVIELQALCYWLAGWETQGGERLPLVVDYCAGNYYGSRPTAQSRVHGIIAKGKVGGSLQR